MGRLRSRGASLHPSVFPFLLYLVIALFAACATSDPTFTVQKFEKTPSYIFYFEDSDTLLVHVNERGVIWRSTDGGMEWKLVSEDDGPSDVYKVEMSPASKKYAMAFGRKGKHWITKDRGDSWNEVDLKGWPDPMIPNAVSYHADDPDKIIIKLVDMMELPIGVVYTTDGFKEKPKELIEKAWQCIWAKEKKPFTTGDEDLDKDQVVCIVAGKHSNYLEDTVLVTSKDYFKHREQPELDPELTVTGLSNVVGVQAYLLAAQRARGTTEMAMYVSRDGSNWSRALFGNQRIESNAYTVMESSDYSIQVDVLQGQFQEPVGSFFNSDFNGTRFKQLEAYTNRNSYGIGDFEDIQGIQGVSIVNIVDNHEELEKHREEKVIKSQITFNDGRDFQSLKTKDGKDLHVHSMVDSRNLGRVFSSPAPGLIMAVGNTGKSLGAWKDGDLYVSDDAGETWTKRLDGPHLYEFGDSGALLVAVWQGGPTSRVMYSTDFGHNWDEFNFKDEEKFFPVMLTTTQDSTSMKFTLMAQRETKNEIQNLIYGLDFSGLDLRKCKDDDFEKWYARVGEDGKAGCVMGHKQSFRRRKQDAKCSIGNEFKEPEPDNSEKCPCTRSDFECEFGLARKDDDCVPTSLFVRPEGVCKGDEKTYEGPPKFRKIPGDTCDTEAGEGLSKKKGEYSCEDGKPPEDHGSGDTPLDSEINAFKHKVKQMAYLERAVTSEKRDETVLVLTTAGEVYRTENQGKKWTLIIDDGVELIKPNPYWKDYVYFLTAGREVLYSRNRGEDVHSFTAPNRPKDDLIPLKFHAKEPGWLLWIGCKEGGSKEKCTSVASVTEKNGLHWEPLLEDVNHCEFMWREGRDADEKLIFCEQVTGEGDNGGRKQLVSSDDFFDHKPTVLSDDMIRWATMSEFVIVAARAEDSLKVDASVDGKVFAQAEFPANYPISHQTSYTLLDSSTHAVFLFVTENEDDDREYGSILKSNSNGTFYAMSIRNVNRNTIGYVDFEKVGGVEGVAFANIVDNAEDVKEGARRKKLKTRITHNDGAAWAHIPAPEKDIDGKDFGCDRSDKDKCALHLQGYTERPHMDDSYSSPSAIGLLIGVGNVGEHLADDYKKCDTFMSDDGGITWRQIQKGQYMWEYGDQGSIIVLVKEGEPTDEVLYSLDMGKTWKSQSFKSKLYVEDLTTVPSDTSRNFLLWTRVDADERGITAAINLDFTGLTDKKCKFDDDYETFAPKHPLQVGGCLFGHLNQYYRKKPDRECYNGPDLLMEKYNTIRKNCSCTEQDYECAYNYERGTDGSCQLVQGLQPLDPTDVCKNPDTQVWYENNGYRRIPLTTCDGGKELDQSKSHLCDGKTWPKDQRISSAGLFFAIVIPLALAGGIGYWIYRNLGDGKLGQIRLGEGGGASIEWNKNQLVQLPVMLVSALAAGAMALPMVAGSVYRGIKKRFGRDSGYRGAYSPSRYTSRSSFARGRGGYTSVNADESDLLGEDSDDDV